MENSKRDEKKARKLALLEKLFGERLKEDSSKVIKDIIYSALIEGEPAEKRKLIEDVISNILIELSRVEDHDTRGAIIAYIFTHLNMKVQRKILASIEKPVQLNEMDTVITLTKVASSEGLK